MLGVATAGADCLGARHALVMAIRDRQGSPWRRRRRASATSRPVPASRPPVCGSSGRHGGRGTPDATTPKPVVCAASWRTIRIRFRACEVNASAAYERAAEVRRHAAEAFRDAEADRNRARSALTDAEPAASRARDALRDARRRGRRE